MAALGLRQLVPSGILSGRWIVVLTCYLDDSGKDPQNRITTLAGYVARDPEWAAFETAVEPIFDKPPVNVLHAMDLEATKGEFKGWSVLKKQSFVAQLCRTLSKHQMLGVSMSAVKQTYADRAVESTRKRTVTPYSFCLTAIIDWLLRDVRTGAAVWKEGVALVLEAGNEHNAEAEEQFNTIRKIHGLEEILRSISFVPKEYCRAIQMADLFAFYSRRDGAALERATGEGKGNHKREQMMKIITEQGEFRAFVAVDFGPDLPVPPGLTGRS